MSLSDKAKLYLTAALANRAVAEEIITLLETVQPNPTALQVNIAPLVDGGQSIGTGTKAFSAVYLKDTITGQIYRLEVENGFLQADEVI